MHNISSDANAQAWCARLIVQELIAAGVEHAVLCPGMRNAPLLFAFHKQLGENNLSHIDERSAAFIALGIAKRSKKPCVVCMTSGSAVANVLPALCEAYAAHVPLIILSADRPQELHHAGAPQCMQQFNIFRDFVASSVQLPSANPDADSMYLCSVQIRDAMQQCLGQSQQPIHINVPLNEPLAPIDNGSWIQLPDPEITEECSQLIECSNALPDSFTQQFNNIQRPLAIAGPDCALEHQDIIAFVEAAGIPLVADACSGLRASQSANIIRCADILGACALLPEKPDALIRIGSAPIARPLYEYCSKQNCPVLRLDQTAIHKDFLHHKFLNLVRPTADCFTLLSQALQTQDSNWLSSWQQADTTSQKKIQQWFSNSSWGEVSAAAQVCSTLQFDFLQCSSSMSVRHANVFSSHQNIIAHRGVNGIDGSIGSFI
ncbi:MAG: 2-succinyl-5-enolpyruvyl-6-hydroxy-3-cyclohexene-1-carboxylic-acid synthase, partial [Planctomycetes bacterium]|nr:2-succinyl-5-enolpyruvyl-6-hydroxy-3-cyclohexene-1-carboxylic-acid synthase [Planctomycetota bacterium]